MMPMLYPDLEDQKILVEVASTDRRFATDFAIEVDRMRAEIELSLSNSSTNATEHVTLHEANAANGGLFGVHGIHGAHPLHLFMASGDTPAKSALHARLDKLNGSFPTPNGGAFQAPPAAPFRIVLSANSSLHGGRGKLLAVGRQAASIELGSTRQGRTVARCEKCFGRGEMLLPKVAFLAEPGTRTPISLSEAS